MVVDRALVLIDPGTKLVVLRVSVWPMAVVLLPVEITMTGIVGQVSWTSISVEKLRVLGTPRLSSSRLLLGRVLRACTSAVMLFVLRMAVLLMVWWMVCFSVLWNSGRLLVTRTLRTVGCVFCGRRGMTLLG